MGIWFIRILFFKSLY